jgi:hypothetical protein
VNANGDLEDKPDYLKAQIAEPVNSGRYYLKFAALDKFYASGEVVLQRGVKNVVSVELE